MAEIKVNGIARWVIAGAAVLFLGLLLHSCRGKEEDVPVSREKKVSSSESSGTKELPLVKSKFIQTHMCYNAHGGKIKPGDEKKLAKFDILRFARSRISEIEGKTWDTIRALNPDIEIFIYIQGVDIWKTWDQEGKFPLASEDLISLNNVARYTNARGHSMGNLNDDNPDLFLLTKKGDRCNTYMEPTGTRLPGWGEQRFLMDFGSGQWVDYWIEAVENDIIKQPWGADGIYLDNTAPVLTFPTETPAKYDTPEKWEKASIWYIDQLGKALREKGQKMMINAGGTSSKEGIAMFKKLDKLEYPPTAQEEGTLVHSWAKPDAQFMSESKWKNSVDCLGAVKRMRHAYISHVKIDRGESGKANRGQPVTFWQAFWYAMCSFQLGKNEEDHNSYFMFWGKNRNQEPWWFEEYDHIDLGRAVGKYKVTEYKGNNIYWREFERGYVYVNPTWNDVVSIKLPEVCKQLSHDNFKDDLKTMPDVKTIDLNSHHGTILVKNRF